MYVYVYVYTLYPKIHQTVKVYIRAARGQLTQICILYKIYSTFYKKPAQV